MLEELTQTTLSETSAVPTIIESDTGRRAKGMWEVSKHMDQCAEQMLRGGATADKVEIERLKAEITLHDIAIEQTEVALGVASAGSKAPDESYQGYTLQSRTVCKPRSPNPFRLHPRAFQTGSAASTLGTFGLAWVLGRLRVLRPPHNLKTGQKLASRDVPNFQTEMTETRKLVAQVPDVAGQMEPPPGCWDEPPETVKAEQPETVKSEQSQGLGTEQFQGVGIGQSQGVGTEQPEPKPKRKRINKSSSGQAKSDKRYREYWGW